jgi:hypothetical protein
MAEFTGPSANFIRQQVNIALAALDPLPKIGADVARQGLTAVIAECEARLAALPADEVRDDNVAVAAEVARNMGLIA